MSSPLLTVHQVLLVLLLGQRYNTFRAGAVRSVPLRLLPFLLGFLHPIRGLIPCRRTGARVAVGRDENVRGRAGNSSTISVFVFYYEKRKRERNSRVRKRKRDITVTEMGGDRKIYRNVLLFNHHLFYMNITLDTPLHKLFFKIMIGIFCFIRLNREIYVLMLRNMREYMA